MLKTILLLNPVYVTLFWAIVLGFYSPEKHNPKNFLGKFMAVAFVVYLSHFFYFTRQFEVYRFIDSLYIWAFLLVYPLYHIYVRLLTVETKFSLKVHWRFLVLPTFMFLIYFAGVLVMAKHEHIDFLAKIIAGKGDPSGFQSYMLWVFKLAQIVFVLQVFYYLYVNFKLIIKNNRNLKDYYSNTEGRQLDWVQFFNISLAVTSVASILVAIAGRDMFSENVSLLLAPSLVFSIMLFLIGLIGNSQNPAYIVDIAPSKEAGSVDYFDISNLKKGLDNLFEKEKIYKNPNLKIWDISTLLGTNRTYVSKLINVEYNRNFCNHVNFYRVKRAKELIKENPRLTNEQVAEMSGFGSVNSLYRAFKTLFYVPLKEFRKDVQSKNY